MRRAIVIALAALPLSLAGRLATADGVSPDPGAACVSENTWTAELQQRSSGVAIAVVADLAGVRARTVVARFNAVPPKIDLTADHVLVIGARGLADDMPAPYVVIAFFNHDCLVAAERADPTGVAHIMADPPASPSDEESI